MAQRWTHWLFAAPWDRRMRFVCVEMYTCIYVHVAFGIVYADL